MSSMSARRNLQAAAGCVVVAVLLLAALIGPIMHAAAQSPGQPDSGTVNRTSTVVLLESTRISGTTRYSPAPSVQGGGRDVANVATWHSADLFLAVDMQTGRLTATVQFSPDASLWADAEYDYVSSNAIAQQAYRRVFTADGNKGLRVPVMGQWVRLKIESSGIATATVQATYRNN